MTMPASALTADHIGAEVTIPSHNLAGTLANLITDGRDCDGLRVVVVRIYDGRRGTTVILDTRALVRVDA